MLEFGTAVNVSAGGVLIAVKRVPIHKDVMLEMPIPPGFSSDKSITTIKGTIVRTQSGPHHTYLGLQFKRPLAC